MGKTGYAAELSCPIFWQGGRVYDVGPRKALALWVWDAGEHAAGQSSLRRKALRNSSDCVVLAKQLKHIARSEDIVMYPQRLMVKAGRRPEGWLYMPGRECYIDIQCTHFPQPSRSN